MPFDAEEAELLAVTQSLCRWSFGTDASSSGFVSALPSTVESLRSVELFLRRDHPSQQPHHRSVGRWQTVQTSLLPLMTTYKRDREVVYPVLKLLVRLTMPLPADSDAAVRRERTGHQLQIRGAMLEGAHLDVLMQWLTPLLARPPAIRSMDDVNIIELSLTLLKNLLAISAGSNTQPNAADDTVTKADALQPSQGRQVGERIIRRYAESGVLDMLAAVCWQPEDLNKFGLLLLEMVAHIVGGVSVDELVTEKRRTEREGEEKRRKERSAVTASQPARNTAGQYSYLWRGQSQASNSSASIAPPLSSPSTSSTSVLGSQLQTVRLNEKTRYVAPSRHSRFGTLLMLPSPLSGSMDADVSAPPLSSGSQLVRNMFDMHAMGSDNLPAFKGRTPRQAHPAAVSVAAGERGVCRELVEFVLQFIGDGCYERLMASTVQELKANVRVVRDDEKNWMTVAALMMGAWREQQTHDIHTHNHNHSNDKENVSQSNSNESPSAASPPAPFFQCEPVMACLSATAFSLLTSKLLLYIQEKPSPLPFLTASLQLYSEIVHTLSCMLRTASPDEREKANQLRHAFYYEKEQLDLLVSLMRQWNAHTWGGSLMALLVECVHWSMQMLDDMDGTHTISERRKRRVVKNKTVLVDGEKQKMAIAELQQALPANVILDADKLNQQQQLQQGEQPGSEQQQQEVPVMAVVVAALVQSPVVATTLQTDVEPIEHEPQHEARDNVADDESEQRAQHSQPVPDVDTQAETVVHDTEPAGMLTARTTAPNSVDTQAATLPLPADSIDSTAETIALIDISQHSATDIATAADRVDSDATTQAALLNDQLEAQMAVDTQAPTQAITDDADPDSSLDPIATQLLPSDEEPYVDVVSGDTMDVVDVQPIDCLAAQMHNSATNGDVSDASLSTLVSEMAIQPLDVVMDSIAPDDTDTALDTAEQIDKQHSSEQPSIEAQPSHHIDMSENEPSNESHPHTLPVDASPVSPTVQYTDLGSGVELVADDEPARAATVPVAASISAASVAPIIATVVSVPAESDLAIASTTAASSAEEVVEGEEEAEVSEDGYFRMEATFNFSAYLLSYANPTILSHYLTLLAGYRTNSSSLNSHIVHFLSRVAFDRQLLPMLFQLSFLQLCDTILNDPLLKKDKNEPRWKQLTSFCKKVVRGFFDWLDREERGEMMFVECLFWKTVNAVELMKGGYRGGDGPDSDRDEDDEDKEARQDEVAWEAEVQAQVDGDWQPGKHSDASHSSQKKAKSASKKKKKTAEAPVPDKNEADESGEEIDIGQLMDEQARKEKERDKREKKEQRRREAEAKERERDRQRRTLMAAEDDDEEEELQLGAYNEQEIEERRRRAQKERDEAAEAAEAEGMEKEWRVDEEQLLRDEYPTFAALKSRYALMSSRLKSRFTQEEVRRKIKQLGLDSDKSEHTAVPSVPASPRPQLRAETDLHTATTDEEQSEVDTSEMAMMDVSSLSAPTTPASSSTSAPFPPATSSSTVGQPPRHSRAPNGTVVDVKGISGALYDLVSSMTRYEHHRPFLEHVIHTLTSCLHQRQQHDNDWKQYTAAVLSPSLAAADSTVADASARRLKRQRQLLSTLHLVRVAGGGWSVQRQYTADKLEAVVAVIERAYGNTMDDCAADGAQTADEEEEDEGVEDEHHTVQETADEQAEASEEETEQAASAVPSRHNRKDEEVFVSLSTPRETRKRAAAQLSQEPGSGASIEQAASLVHAEDEMDDAELADFLRQRRNKLLTHTSARSVPQQPQSQQRTAHSDDSVGPLTTAGRGHRGRLRKAAADEQEEEGDETEDAAHRTTTDAPLPVAHVADAETVTKRRRVILDDEEEVGMDIL